MLEKFKVQVKDVFDAKLPFEILDEFKPLGQKYLDEKDAGFKAINDKLIIIDLNERLGSIISLTIAIVFLLFLVIIGPQTKEGLNHPITIFFLSLAFVSILFFSYKIHLNQQVEIILNREKGIFSFPHRINKNKQYTLKFNQAIVFWIGTGGATGVLQMQLVAQHPEEKVGGANLEAHETNYRKIWSFYVWYMDKNRPLPPGTAFDPYRQQDFERRKAEGFPKPLYRSHIHTPEATPNQQAERDKYWKDKLEQFTREPNSGMFDSDIHKNWRVIKYESPEGSAMSNTYYRFEFANGEIVYMKTDENGSGFEPFETEKFTAKRIELTESWF